MIGESDLTLGIAVIGMAGRFPGADSVERFWDNLHRGRAAIEPIAQRDFLDQGGDPAWQRDLRHVPVVATIPGIAEFDAEFFGYSPSDATILDPQHRLFLECAQHAFDDAGYAPERVPGPVGVYAGCAQARYYNAYLGPRYLNQPGSLDNVAAQAANSPGTLAARVAYAFGLTGPSVNVHTACSTSLVAVHLAIQDLLLYRCDLALAGGVALNPQAALGYWAEPDGPFSPTGQVRAFDADADGMLPGYGLGTVVLKRLDEAIADGDTVRAVLLGSAVNNDGRRKAGLTAVSAAGQREVILAALADAQVEPATVGYVEAHGTGTPVGDPVELTALSEVFHGAERGAVLLGAVKSNIGHLDVAAGIAGLIKTALVVQHGVVPANPSFRIPNPLFELESSALRVPTETTDWPGSRPRRAGVSSFGVGGTNGHIVLQEPPEPPPSAPALDWSLLLLSARSPAALASAGEELGSHLRAHPELHIADVAHTLSRGRVAHPFRRAVVCPDAEAAAALLADPVAPPEQRGEQPVALLLPGGGSHYDGMGGELYRTQPVFREALDRCAEILRDRLSIDLVDVLYGATTEVGADHTSRLDGVDGSHEPLILPALVSVEYSMAALLEATGIRPAALLGHSAGEYTAACLAGTLSLEDTLTLVTERERLFTRAGGASVSVQLGEVEVGEFLVGSLELAAVNAATSCTVSGHLEDIVEFQVRLTDAGIGNHRLRLPAAAHSRVLEPVLDEFRAVLREVTFHPPRIPIVSNLTGTWLTNEQAGDPEYWVRHSVETVRFSAGLEQLAAGGHRVLLEAGPGHVTSTLATRHLGDQVVAAPTMRHAYGEQADLAVLLRGLGTAWTHGVEVDPTALDPSARRRVPLPGYPFQRRRYWVEPLPYVPAPPPSAGAPGDSSEAANPISAQRPAPAVASRPPLGYEPTPPRSEAEAGVLAVWEDVLKLHGLGVRDNFFDLGGDSLLLMRLVSAATKHLGIPLSARRLHLGRRLDVAGFVLEAAETRQEPTPTAREDT